MMTAQAHKVNPELCQILFAYGCQVIKNPFEVQKMLNPKKTLAALFVMLPMLAMAQSAPVLRITGAAVTPSNFSATDLAQMPRLTVDVQNPHNGQMEHYEGVRVSDLLAKVGAPLGDKLRGKAMATYVQAIASDGYSVVYSLAELDPAFHENQSIIADRLNGKPLDAKEGPFKAVIPGDKRPARWIRMLTELQVENVAPANAPAMMK